MDTAERERERERERDESKCFLRAPLYSLALCAYVNKF
jgi:hypothetical protein